jgi:hypothetical protein
VGIPSVKLFIALDEPIGEAHRSLASIYQQHANAPEPKVEVNRDDSAFVI